MAPGNAPHPCRFLQRKCSLHPPLQPQRGVVSIRGARLVLSYVQCMWGCPLPPNLTQPPPPSLGCQKPSVRVFGGTSVHYRFTCGLAYHHSRQIFGSGTLFPKQSLRGLVCGNVCRMNPPPHPLCFSGWWALRALACGLEYTRSKYRRTPCPTPPLLQTFGFPPFQPPPRVLGRGVDTHVHYGL
jgi:hypothetical protein